MSGFTQLSAAEIEERFHITGQRPVQFLLAGLAEQGEQFAVQFNEGREHFLTLLLAAPPGKGTLIFDCSGSPEINRRLLASQHNVFSGRPGGIQVQFSTGPASEVIHAGARAFAVALPAYVLRLQRREAFRIETPQARPLQFYGRLPDGSVLNLPAHDISCAGIGLTATMLPETLVLGTTLSNACFALPDDKGNLFVEASVRHLTACESRAGSRHWRVGLEFRHYEHTSENRIQRYIARIEHERRELR